MTWEQALTPTLEQTLNLILSSLANFFGTTAEAIMQNAPAWLAKYGWYVTLHNEIVEWMLGGLFAGALLVGGFLLIWACTSHEISKGIVAISVILFFFGFFFIMAFPIVTCFVAPEIVGLEAAIELIS